MHVAAEHHAYDEFLQLVNQDLAGRITAEGACTLRADLHRWLGVLYAVRKSVGDQINDRDRVIETGLEKEVRSSDFAMKVTEHRTWLRKANRFRMVIKDRINQVRGMLPEDDLRTLLFQAVQIGAEDAEGIRAWQEKARRVLAL